MFRQFGLNELLMLLSGLRWTIGLTLLAFAGSFALGLLLLIPRVARSRPLRWAASGWIPGSARHASSGLVVCRVFRPAAVRLGRLEMGGRDVGSVNLRQRLSGHIWRGAVEAIPSGQWEASAALGLTRWRQLRLVVLPQAFTIAIPPTVGFLVQLIKNTSLASVIGVIELSREAQLVNGATFAPFLVYGCVCVLYFVLCYPLTAWSRTLEVRLAR